jgi:hypothetical protein
MTETNQETRPAIPAELKRRILVEAGHRCSIPVCRHIEVDVHHIEDWAKTKTHEYDNLIALCPNCHRMAHTGKIDKLSMRQYKRNLRYATDKFSSIELDLLFHLSHNKYIQQPKNLLIFFQRIIDANYVQLFDPPGGVYIGGMNVSSYYLEITPEGRKFINLQSNLTY